MNDFVKYIPVTAAYGRRYENAEDALKDWYSGKDFVAHPLPLERNYGTYCNVRDFQPTYHFEGKKVRIYIRYGGPHGLDNVVFPEEI